MEFKGFGKNSGPVVPPKSQAPFGDMPRPPYSPPHPFTPPFPDSSSKSFARAFDPPKRTHSPSSTFTINNPATGLSQVPATLNSYAAPKRTRSPPSLTEEAFQENSNPKEDINERELQAKAKRLARFKGELSDLVENGLSVAHRNFPSTKSDQFVMEKQKLVGDYWVGSAWDLADDIDDKGLELSGIIVGLCPDMCPESERAERERKGDLDQYERLDGDRHQTSKALAVKKYNRTAEREAELIRPLPILQKTMAYLLNLLDQPYDDSFLGLYNFLWDRMRAIRMDLRMQHIFDHEAITMLEQMIRLHIIAMHELCEYTKGEGFSEGFDAHLNIEQMNKTSVDLFQMYDDHRKKGVHFPTEKEFRGYYALLKLDKHPGYRVEPAELSVDLAKMTPEIRQTREVRFARDVARSCRTGNFIAFFRLARKASYLQACLMHAHFSKLRTQALASLHSGLQNNQGVPVAHVAKWLGMEREEIESLLEYHGFLIKEFEEPYMVKEGPFLNNDHDYPTRCSKLVDSKKSGMISENLLSSHQASLPTPEDAKFLQFGNVHKNKHGAVHSIGTESFLSFTVMDEEMTDSTAISSPRDGVRLQHAPKSPRIKQPGQDGYQRDYTSSPKGIMTNESFPPWYFSTKFLHEAGPSHLESVETPVVSVENPLGHDVQSDSRATPFDFISRRVEQEKPSASLIDSAVKGSMQNHVFAEEFGAKDPTDAPLIEEDELVPEEVAIAKITLLIRRWKRHSSRKKMLREQNRLATIAALNSLSLGPPVWQNKDRPTSYGKFNIDQVISKRHEKHEQSWSRLNVSDVVATALSERNANSNCICWKVIILPQMHHGGIDVGQTNQVADFSVYEWLHSKLMPSKNSHDDDNLLVSSPGLSIWRKWFLNHSGIVTCCLSVIKDATFGNFYENLMGASAILYPLSQSISWELQKIQLHNLVASLPTGSQLPLVILSGLNEQELPVPSSSIIDKLGLRDIEMSLVRSFLIISLAEIHGTRHLHGYFSDDRLREGLKWLATNSHPQPILHHVKTRELVSTCLNSSFHALDHVGAHRIGPDDCISVFNEALDQSVASIVATAKENNLNWPCPELSLLDESTNEHRAVNNFLPKIGWSSTEKIDPVISALSNCKLPTFSDDVSWLARGSSAGLDIENQKVRLQDILVRYLTKSRTINVALATKEVGVMLQKFTRLELRDANYYLVPGWVPIFRRVFNWQLNGLSSGPGAAAYVSEKFRPSPCSPVLWNSGPKPIPSLPYHIDHPSLDEMVEFSFSPNFVERGPSDLKALQPIPMTMSMSDGYTAVDGAKPCSLSQDNSEAIAKTDYSVDKESHHLRDRLLSDDDVYLIKNKFEESGVGILQSLKSATAADRVSELLQQCNMLQKQIEEKLWVYF
ncbi:hypothetical protein Nepgr_020642 [Nepenthes gracilis]|uniref:PCI domain-containing protein n=1 Tax=Nepenthes gracilis TaxID=150966 RepID=A0AAD3SZ49_NEPGR|nr:hypothetical protein Nepgr_020642 [Nepenthes gracilis]